MQLKLTIDELCPHCGQTVELEEKFEIQKCPVCGALIQPCSLCSDMRCDKCPLEK